MEVVLVAGKIGQKQAEDSRVSLKVMRLDSIFLQLGGPVWLCDLVSLSSLREQRSGMWELSRLGRWARQIAELGFYRKISDQSLGSYAVRQEGTK